MTILWYCNAIFKTTSKNNQWKWNKNKMAPSLEILIHRCALNDEKALNLLYQQSSGKLYALLLRMLSRKDIASWHECPGNDFCPFEWVKALGKSERVYGLPVITRRRQGNEKFGLHSKSAKNRDWFILEIKPSAVLVFRKDERQATATPINFQFECAKSTGYILSSVTTVLKRPR